MFTERPSHLGLHFRSVLQQPGLAVGAHLGLPTSPSSLLRLAREAAVPSQEQPAKSIGIDDWSYKRKLSYGTLICDLETRRPLDLLPDRSVQRVSTWLQQHPEVDLIRRDRWSEYATAAQKAAPQVVQVA